MSTARVSSVARFKAMTKALQEEVRRETISDLNAAADGLVVTMRAAAPLGPTGNLRQSIRKEPGKGDMRVRVVAGGPLTTVEVRRGSGVRYDYARAVEFGTQGAPAHPFFWSTWRSGRKKIRSKIKRKIAASVKKRSAV